jgi:hypothetical protein
MCYNRAILAPKKNWQNNRVSGGGSAQPHRPVAVENHHEWSFKMVNHQAQKSRGR